MPRNRKYFANKTVLFVTSRAEEGLPFPCNAVMNLILWGILARAREKHQIKVCHFIFLANHLHMLLVVENPEHVSSFVGYIKCESAHAVNRLLGRRKRTIWEDGYDSPVVLTPDSALNCIGYIYGNPARANLVDCWGEALF
jgi:REP element-mobilizing transposase RayT